MAGVIQVDANVMTSIGQVRLVRQNWVEPTDSFGVSGHHRLQLSFMPLLALARGCYPDQWGPHRWERIGDILFLPADRPVRAISECRHQISIVCDFYPDGIAQWLGEDIEWTDDRLSAGLDMMSPLLRQQLVRINDELREPGFASETMIELMAAQVAITLGRHFRLLGVEPKTGGLPAWRLKLIDDRLKVLESPPSLAELASLCSLSVRQLARGFRVSRNRSIGTYIASAQIDRAKQMLIEGATVKTAAYAAGFKTPSNFTVAFGRAMGMKPREYRQRMGKG